MTFTKAVRKSVPMLISLAGASGSGKTYSGLLLASGLAGPDGRVGFIDTENGRGSMYADSPGIVKVFPAGYEIGQFDPPFSPERYIAAITAAEQSGINVLVIDSATHEWEGTDGCCDIAEKNKLKGMPNWSKAKMAHKRFVNHCLSSRMHIVFCLRARDKVKIVKDANGKEQIVPIGIQPICEKNFVFEMLISLLLDEQTHHALPLKVPEPLAPLFPRDSSRMLTADDGARIRRWNETGREFDLAEQTRKRARLAAEGGMAEYKAFWAGLSAVERKSVGDTAHAENKHVAETADKASVREFDDYPDPAEFDPHTVIAVKGARYTNGEELTGWSRAEGA